jgi:hypothetical protein
MEKSIIFRVLLKKKEQNGTYPRCGADLTGGHHGAFKGDAGG